MEDKFSNHEIALINIAIAKNEFVIDISSRKKNLEKKIRDFRKKIKNPDFLREFDEHFDTENVQK